MNKIGVIHIIKDHIRTLWNISTNKQSKGDIFLFFISPLLISVLLIYLDINLKQLSSDLLKSIAIFSAFLFNMLAIVNSAIKDIENEEDKSPIKELYAKEIHSNLSFNILIGIILVITLMIEALIDCEVKYCQILLQIIDSINIYFLGVFILTLLMCLNRVYILLRKK